MGILRQDFFSELLVSLVLSNDFMMSIISVLHICLIIMCLIGLVFVAVSCGFFEIRLLVVLVGMVILKFFHFDGTNLVDRITIKMRLLFAISLIDLFVMLSLFGVFLDLNVCTYFV